MLWLITNSMFFLLGLLSTLIYFIYYCGTHTYSYWRDKGIKFIKPKYPYFGTFYEAIFSLKSIHEKQIEIYNHFKGERFGGIFSFKKPLLFIKDPFLVESILVKDFTFFYNRNHLGGDAKHDPLSAHLLNLQDMEWKSLRQKLTPTFSSGKLRGMHEQLVQCSDDLVKYINNYLNKSEPMEIREVMAKFSTDVIGSCAFGLNTNALSDPNSQFRKIGRQVLEPSFSSRLRFAVRSQYPRLVRILRWKGMSEGVANFFTKIMKDTMLFREKNNVVRNDFVQLLMELKKQELEKQKSGLQENDQIIIDDHVITSNAFVFFVAGFETTASTLSYCLYELSLHQDIQERAYQHIANVLKKYSGEVTFDAIKEMTFLHQIFAETLRIHPPASELRRVSSQNYIIPGTDIMLPKGSSVSIPTYALHHNPEYFPEPEKFKPERFCDKSNIKKGTYLPFGDGPRICIGKRFAEMEMQVGMVKLLLNFKFTLNSKTISPLIYNPASFLLVPIGGIWLNLEKRI